MSDRDDNLIILTENYNGPDRRDNSRRRKDRRQSLPMTFDEYGEIITERGSVINIEI